VLILFARGGLRSHCLFNAVGEFQHNPFGTQTAAVVRHQTRLVYGRDATDDEVDFFESAYQDCNSDCGPVGRARSVCVALLGSAETLFY
jgi:hypothetical protein